MFAPAYLALALAAVDPDEALLTRAGVKPDGPGLIAFLKARTPSDKEGARLAALVRRLGDDDFEVREKAGVDLVAAGPLALPALRAAASDKDAEVRRRAGECRREIEGAPHAQYLEAALRLLAKRKPDGAAKTLLDYLSLAEPEGPSEVVLAALVVVGLRDGAPTPEVRGALTDRSLARRAAGAHVVGRSAVAHRKLLAPLLRDPAPLVRFEAARGLLTAGDRGAVPVLIALLGEGPVSLGSPAEELLLIVAGESAPLTFWTPAAAKRREVQAAWQKWWAGPGAKVDLAKVRFGEAPLGLTVICEFTQGGAGPGHIRAFGRDGKERWVVSGMDSPTDFHLLPGGRLLVAEHHPRRITERDRTGKVLWEAKVGGQPVSCQRLPNGNTFVATYNALLEVDPAGKELYSIPSRGGMIFSGTKLRDGRIFSLDSSGTVREFDKDRKEVRAIRPANHANGGSSWAGLEPQPGDRYLLARYNASAVLEMDATGKILWQAKVTSPAWATRLRDGNTLVACLDPRHVVELDRAGKEVRRIQLKHRPFRARRY